MRENYFRAAALLRKQFMVLVVALALVFGLSTGILAQEGGSGIQVSPTRSELIIEPGKSETVKISLRNTTSGDVIAKPVINDFVSDNTTGDPKLVVDPEEPSPYSIENFISGLEDVDLKAGESKDLQLFVQVPSDQPSGAYYGAIRFNAVPAGGSQAPTEGAPQVSLTASVGVLMLIEVPGDIVEKIELQSVDALVNGKTKSVFLAKPNQVGVTIKNLGNGFAKPFGKVVVKNMLGKEVASYEMNNTNPRGNVLPNSSRMFVDGITGAVTWPGRYTVTANISHGRGGEVLTMSNSFWYIPLWALIVFLLLLTVLIVAAYRLYRRYIAQPVTKHRHR